MCIFRKDKERGFFKSFGIFMALIPTVWALVDFGNGKSIEGSIKLIWLVTAAGNFALGYMTAALEPHPACNLVHLPADAKVSNDEHLEAENDKRHRILGHEPNPDEPGLPKLRP